MAGLSGRPFFCGLTYYVTSSILLIPYRFKTILKRRRCSTLSTMK